jgi:hypothetical protein
MKLISESEIALLSSKDRRTVANLLQGLVHEPGPHGAKLYASTDALARIFGPADDSGQESYHQARTREAIATATLREVQGDVLRKTRIPHDVIDLVEQETFLHFANSLKALQDKVMTRAVIDALFTQLREGLARARPPEEV